MPIDISKRYMDEHYDGIVVGWDHQLTFSKLCLISFYIQKGTKCFGTNPDRYTMIGGYKVPGCGSIIAAIESSTDTKVEIIGKPNTFIIDKLIKEHGLKKE